MKNRLANFLFLYFCFSKSYSNYKLFLHFLPRKANFKLRFPGAGEEYPSQCPAYSKVIGKQPETLFLRYHSLCYVHHHWLRHRLGQ